MQVCISYTQTYHVYSLHNKWNTYAYQHDSNYTILYVVVKHIIIASIQLFIVV